MLFDSGRSFLKLTWCLLWASVFFLLVCFASVIWEPLSMFGFLAAFACLYVAIIVEVTHIYFGKD